MKSKTSFFNGTVFRKNLTRFAPLWILYTLCLILGMAMMYVADTQNFWFASNMGELIQYAAIINLFYAPLAAMLLFGDLFNSRMCNALHAMPLTRECWFTTNVITGLVFSLVPTAVMCALSVPLLMNTCVVGAEWIALWAFLGINLSYICFFGLAVFSVFCAGNRLGMAAVYAALNGGAWVVYFLVDTIYTPMLYGVVTPTTWVTLLTPVARLNEAVCVNTDSYLDLLELFKGRESEMVAHFWLEPTGWQTLAIWAAVGVAFMIAGLLLYRKRKLECAGDIMAIRGLEPVFAVCFAVCAAAFAAVFLELFFSYSIQKKVEGMFLICGLVAGWFAARMLIERTVRVFRLKNWLGLAALTAVLAVSLGLTYYDVLGIETWTPAVEDVKSVTFGYSTYRGMSEELTEAEDIEAVIRLQSLALEDQVEEGGSHPMLNGQFVEWEDVPHEELNNVECRYASNIYIYYTMTNGRTVQRKYIIWCDGEEGQIVNEYLSRWEVVHSASSYGEIATTAIGDIAADGDVTCISVWGTAVPAEYCTQESIESLLAAIKADCDARNMTQTHCFHSGSFQYTGEDNYVSSIRNFWIEIYTEDGRSGDFNVFADSENTLNWLEERDLLPFEVLPDNDYLD